MKDEKLVIITRMTALEELLERHGTLAQARFYITSRGADFAEYEAAHRQYCLALKLLKESIPAGVAAQFIERARLPTFTFGPADLIVALGQDGLVVNAAKYLDGHPVLALSPDAARVDGILVPFLYEDAPRLIPLHLKRKLDAAGITMAKVELNDGQTLRAVNDLFIGQRTHLSARYRLVYGKNAEDQSSSGIIVSTGAGSTGWFRSIVTGAAGFMERYAGKEDLRPWREKYRFAWDADFLRFTVREPFVSKISSAGTIHGKITRKLGLELISQMPQNGVIFGDGIEADYLEFNSGAIARITIAETKLNLARPG